MDTPHPTIYDCVTEQKEAQGLLVSGDHPSIVLPGQFDGHALSKLAAAIIDCWSPDGAPSVIIFDFSRLNFIRPAGVALVRAVDGLHEVRDHRRRRAAELAGT
jgi:hypothetical protein